MRLVTISMFVASIICTSANFANAHELVDNKDYNCDDTVAVNALFDGQDSVSRAVYDDVTNVPTLERQTSQDAADDTYCVTPAGLSGSCSSVQECFPRLFPLSTNIDDTPIGIGVYNPNLAKMLVEAYGLCGKPSPADGSSFRNGEKICCATNKVAEYPLENDTMSVEPHSTGCGLLKIDPSQLPTIDKIVGGRKAALGEFPWMVGILRRGQQFCGGSLLDSKNVLTAGHCVEFMTKNDVAAVRLHLGDLDIGSSKETNHVERKAKRILYHKGFTMKNLDHDIAIIHLDKPVEFSKTIQPVCLHSGDPPYDTGKDFADVSGWGTTYSGGPQSSHLLAVQLNVITQQECNKKYAEAKKKIGAGMVCASSKGRDSCQGDSGGPLVLDARGQGKQIGIVSWGIGCATYPGVYTRVDKYKRWIAKNKQ